MTTKTLRFYESIGLLPAPERTPSGYRDYAPEVTERVQFIRDAQSAGLTLAEVTSVLELRRCREPLLRAHTGAGRAASHRDRRQDRGTRRHPPTTRRSRTTSQATRPRRLHRPAPLSGHRAFPLTRRGVDRGWSPSAGPTNRAARSATMSAVQQRDHRPFGDGGVERDHGRGQPPNRSADPLPTSSGEERRMEFFQVIEAVRHSPVISRRCRRGTTGSAVPVLDDVSFTVGPPTVFAVRHSRSA